MKAIREILLVGFLGLAVLLGSSAVALAAPKIVAGTTYCSCNCVVDGNYKGTLFWEKKISGACSLADGGKCTITSGGIKYQGQLSACWQCTGTAEGACMASAQAGGGASVRPGTATQGGSQYPSSSGVIGASPGTVAPTGSGVAPQ